MKRLVLVASAGAVLACSESGPNAPKGPTPAAFGIRPALDTVDVGETVLFVAERADSTVDEWTVSDSGIARLLARQRGRATVLTRAAGTVTVKARRQGDSGQATLVVVLPPPPPPPASFVIRPALDTIAVGASVNFLAERADSTVDQWVLSDSGLARVVARERGRATVVTRAPGTVTVTARRQSDSGQATLVIRPPTSFVIRPAVDTACIGDRVVLIAERTDSTVDEWVSSDTNIARVAWSHLYWATVLPLAPGTVTFTARRQGDSGHATLVVRPSDTPAGWEAITLAPLDGTTGLATAVNESGMVVGYLQKGWYNPVTYGFVYTDGVMHRLQDSPDRVVNLGYPMAVGSSGTIAGMTWGSGGGQLVVWDSPDAAPRTLGVAASDSKVIGVNALADVLANQGDRWLGAIHAVLWRQDGPHDLGALTDTIWWGGETYATAWNASGQIVGASKINRISDGGGDSHKLFHPILWENGVMRDLGVLKLSPCVSVPGECSWGEATGINAHGVVVGTSSTDSVWRAFVWENGAMRDLGVFPGHYTEALAINDRGQILGGLGRGYPYGNTIFLWDNGETHIVINGTEWPGPVLGPNGEVVGSMMVVRDSLQHAFIWQAGHLTDLGRGSAVGVDGRGEVIGNRGLLPTLWRKKG